MTIHYHGTPVNPADVFPTLAGNHFCVSHYDARQDAVAHRQGQSVMLDNGAFSAWKAGEPITDWSPYYAWADHWLDYPTTWAVIPDVIGEGGQAQDALIAQWPHGDRGAPVWHMDEPVERLLRLLDAWQRVCIGSTDEYRVVLSDVWQRRMDEVWREINGRHRRTPNTHMLRGMQLTFKHRWPFASVDSTDIARNHNRDGRPRARADRWNAAQCPPRFIDRGEQGDLYCEPTSLPAPTESAPSRATNGKRQTLLSLESGKLPA